MTHRFLGSCNAKGHTVTLGCKCEEECSVGECILALRRTDLLAGLKGSNGDTQGTRVSQSDILGSGNDETSGDKAWFFATLEHQGEPVQSGIGVAATHRLNKG